MLDEVRNARRVPEHSAGVNLVRNITDHGQQLWHPGAVDLMEILNVTRTGTACLCVLQVCLVWVAVEQNTRSGRSDRWLSNWPSASASRRPRPTAAAHDHRRRNPTRTWRVGRHQRPPVGDLGLHGVRLVPQQECGIDPTSRQLHCNADKGGMPCRMLAEENAAKQPHEQGEICR